MHLWTTSIAGLPKEECNSVHVINDITWLAHLASNDGLRKTPRPLVPAPFDIRNKNQVTDIKSRVLIGGTRINPVTVANTDSDRLTHIRATTQVRAPDMGSRLLSSTSTPYSVTFALVYVKIRALPGAIHLLHSYQILSTLYVVGGWRDLPLQPLPPETHGWDALWLRRGPAGLTLVIWGEWIN